MSYSRGDVVLVRWPNSNLTGGKAGPPLVVQADGLTTGLPQLAFAMISSNVARIGPASCVSIAQRSPLARGTGLRMNSVVMADNLATVHLRELIGGSVG